MLECVLCKKDTLIHKPDEKAPTIKSFDCETCSTLNIFYLNDTLGGWIFHKEYRNHQYSVSYSNTTQKTVIKSCDLNHLDRGTRKLIEFQGHITRLNPLNFEQKIGTVLTFL